MVLLELFIALVVALILSGAFALWPNPEKRKTGLFWLFLILFLATWAGGLWIRPFGPTVFGIHWLTFLLVGLILALILSITSPQRPPRGRHETLDILERIEQEKEMERFAHITLNTFFWVLLGGLIMAIIIHYIWK
jgi:hypothetical protein